MGNSVIRKGLSDKLVSIVLPTYNRGYCLARAINSVLIQTYENWELLIVDNNSSDETNELLREYVDLRIKVHHLNNEGIIARARNFGLSSSRGDWVAFLDSDDWWEREKLETAVCQEGSFPDFAIIEKSEASLTLR